LVIANARLFTAIPVTAVKETRNSAIADKPHDAFRGQSRSPNIQYV